MSWQPQFSSFPTLLKEAPLLEHESPNQFDEIYRLPQTGYLVGQILGLVIIGGLAWGIWLSNSIHDKSSHGDMIFFVILIGIGLAVEFYFWEKKNWKIGLDYSGIHILSGESEKDFIRWSEVTSAQENYTKNLLILEDFTGEKKIKISRGLTDYDKFLETIKVKCGKYLKKTQLPISLTVIWSEFLKVFWMGLAIILVLLLVFWDRHGRDGGEMMLIVIAVLSVQFFSFYSKRPTSLKVSRDETVLKLMFQTIVLKPGDIQLVQVGFQSQRHVKTYYLVIKTTSGKTYRIYEDLSPISQSKEIFQQFMGDSYREGPPQTSSGIWT
jgi:hypothetical protein